MNYLAHLYLSGEDEGITVGNFISDSVKGMIAIEKYPKKIQEGILLHRRIDHFMDNHPIVKEGAKRLKPEFGRWSGVIMDLFYDHYLSVHWSKFVDVDLDSYVESRFRMIENNWEVLPDEIKDVFPKMKNGRWLLHYGNLEGLKIIFEKMDVKINRGTQMVNAVSVLADYYDEYEKEFFEYMKEVHVSFNM